MSMPSVFHVLIDIDALLDTRLGVIDIFNHNLAVKLSEDYRYINRVYDEFSDIIDDPAWSDADFKDTYDHRDESVLAHSKPTLLLFDIQKFLAVLIKEILQHPDLDKLIVSINLHPYTLSSETVIGIMSAIAAHLGKLTEYLELKPTSIAPELITAAYSRREFSHWFTYDLNAWVKAHFSEDYSEAVYKEKMNPRFVIVSPRKFIDKASFIGYLELMNNCPVDLPIKDPFTELAFRMLPYVTLNYEDIPSFSIISKARLNAEDIKKMDAQIYREELLKRRHNTETAK